jgi:multidrug efflux pump subunit AcrB
MGIVVNNAIVLLDYINFERSQLGKTVVQACRDAVQQRFRPIMLSTITTIIGLIPLTLGDSELFKPMAIALMSGLMVATLLTLVIIPVIYSLLIREDKVQEQVMFVKLKHGDSWKKYKE